MCALNTEVTNTGSADSLAIQINVENGHSVRMWPDDQKLSYAAGGSRQPETFPANLNA